jgi:translation initiation factor 3 subunit I
LFIFVFVYTAPKSTRDDPAPLHKNSLTISVDDNDKAICLGWTIADEYLIAGFDSGLLVKYDVNVGKEIMRKKIHEDRIHKINFNREKSMAVTASKDFSSKLIDPLTLEVIKTYKTDRPVNSAVISPTHPHIIIGGGQEASAVTTSAASGKFETRFYHMIYEEEFGRVKGHFGPINALDVHPFGKSFASGSEDG